LQFSGAKGFFRTELSWVDFDNFDTWLSWSSISGYLALLVQCFRIPGSLGPVLQDTWLSWSSISGYLALVVQY